jgi:S-adenosyl-L-methionine hydrolase (adenosine-forming)
MITLSSDFGVQTQGIGIMEAVIHEINPQAKVIHLYHGLPSFGLLTAAWAMESVSSIKPGIHVCVVDPGVGTQRKAIIILTMRGDFLIGPDNGVLLPAARVLGGISKAVAIENETFMKQPVSPVFHGRDIFSPAAAYLSMGINIAEFGKEIKQLAAAPYDDAKVDEGKIDCIAIHINKFGSVHLNLLQDEFDRIGTAKVKVQIGKKSIIVPYEKTFADVAEGKPLIFKDDYRRMELAMNKGDFSKEHEVNLGDRIILHKI